MALLSIKKDLRIKKIAIIFTLLCAQFFGIAYAAQHTIYIPFIRPNERIAEDLRYNYQIREARIALTDEIPNADIPNIPTQGATAYPQEPLRITRAGNGFSEVTLRVLGQDNDRNTATHSVTMIVRDRDLYVLGFINHTGLNGAARYFRLALPPPRQSGRATQHASFSYPLVPHIATAQVGNRVTDLNLSFDYPYIEAEAGATRYYSRVGQRRSRRGSNQDIRLREMRVSMSTLRRSVEALSEFTSQDVNSNIPLLSNSLLRILVTYFEGMRFHSVANSIDDAGIEDGQTWRVSQHDIDDSHALDTNNWASISEFGSQDSLGEERSFERTNSLRLLYGNGGGRTPERYVRSASDPNVSSEYPTWNSVVAVVLRNRWEQVRNVSHVASGQYLANCPQGGLTVARLSASLGALAIHRYSPNRPNRNRPRRDAVSVVGLDDTPETYACQGVVVPFGNTSIPIEKIGGVVTNLIFE